MVQASGASIKSKITKTNRHFGQLSKVAVRLRLNLNEAVFHVLRKSI